MIVALDRCCIKEVLGLLVGIGSDCGYGTWVGQAAVDPDVVWAKFAAMAQGARIASTQFWK